MTIIEKYIQAAENKDFLAVSELFGKDGHYCDYTPNGASESEFHVYGREAIAMFFRNKFIFHAYSFSQPQALNDHQIQFISSIGDFNVLALADIQCDDDGLIDRMIVRPR